MVDKTQKALDFDKNVRIGMVVCCRWTWGGGHYEAKAKVTKINKKSIRAKLLHPVRYDSGNSLNIGHEIIIPRMFCGVWNQNNRFLGKSRYEVRDKRGVYETVKVEAFSCLDARIEAIPLMFGCPIGYVDAKLVENLFVDTVAKWLEDL